MGGWDGGKVQGGKGGGNDVRQGEGEWRKGGTADAGRVEEGN